MTTKEEAAKELASKHYQVEAGLTHIYRITGGAEASPAEPIKLLEVNQYTVPSGIMPIQFGPVPDRGIHYPSVIVEVTPEEYQRIRDEELRLPSGWAIGDLIPRPAAEEGIG